MDGRVGELYLTVRSAEAEAQGAALREPAERFAKRVLVRCDELLEARSPERIVLLRELDMNWRLFDSSLELDVEVTAFATEIADAIDARASVAKRLPSPSDDIAVFESEVAWRASHLVAVARREPSGSWYFARLEAEGDAPGALARVERRSLAVAVVLKLARDRTLAEVLAGLPGRAVVALSRAILGDVEGSSAAIEDAAGAGLARSDSKRSAIGLLTSFASEISGCSIERARRPATGPDGNPTETTNPMNAPEGGSTWRTSFGGLFYLLNPALELGVGEILWKACAHEGAILSRAAAIILGTAGAHDIGSKLFGGVPPDAPLAVVPAEAQREAALVLFEAIVRALPRRGLAALPEVAVALVGERGHRILVVTPRGTEFVLLALPADTPQEAGNALEAFLERWPVSAGRPHASPGLAELDGKGRLLAKRGGLVPALPLPDAPDVTSAALIAQVAGTMGYLFAARVSAQGVAGASELVTRYFTIDARITIEPEVMTVELPMDGIDVAVRGAGLDANPGRVPWLGRQVTLGFLEAMAHGE